GTTDNGGRWTFPKPAPGRYVVTVDAGAGHKTTIRLTIPGEGDATDIVNADGPATGNSGRTRSEFTRIPWERILLGLAVIAGVGIGLHVMLRRNRPAESSTK